MTTTTTGKISKMINIAINKPTGLYSSLVVGFCLQLGIFDDTLAVRRCHFIAASSFKRLRCETSNLAGEEEEETFDCLSDSKSSGQGNY